MGYRLSLFLIEFLEEFHFRNLLKLIDFRREDNHECHLDAIFESGNF